MSQRLIFHITSPVSGAVVGRNIAVQGRARVTGVGFPAIAVETLEVTFSDGGIVRSAGMVQGEWRWEGTPAPTSTGGSSLTITATVTGTTTADDESLPELFDASVSVDVTLESGVPETLTIDSFTSPVTPAALPYHLDLTGTAGDSQSGIRAVQIRLGAGAFIDAVDEGAGFATWARPLDLPAGDHHITVRAVDGLGNTREATADLSVAVPSEPDLVDEIFRPTRYLRELIAFAARYVEVDGSTDVLTPAMLEARLHQPFDRLGELAMAEPASRSVAQARIAVEVLRTRLGSAAEALDTRFRALAYRTLMQQLGSSYDELRLARNATPEAREVLATRLGIDLGPARPDRLDALTLDPDSVSDEQLRELFGFRPAESDDPLIASSDTAALVLWQRDALTGAWARADAADRDSAAGPRPIIEPDIIAERDLRTGSPDDPAAALLTQRGEWIAQVLAEIEAAVSSAGESLATFDELILTQIGPLDLVGLSARDADGADVRSDIGAVDLDLDAVRFLARCRELLVAGTPLESEVADVVSILVQVRKRREYLQWRLEERRASIVLGPSSFVVAEPDPRAPRIQPAWRARPADAIEWRRTLAARVATLATIDDSARALVEAAEAVVMPAWRDALIDELANEGPPPHDRSEAADRLTRELMIDLRVDGEMRTTRADQALETLQAVLFSARVGRLDLDGDGREWTIGVTATDERDFDREWDWMGEFRSWLAAMRVFAYPENQLLPSLYVADGALAAPTAAFRGLVEQLRAESRLTGATARDIAADYMAGLRAAGSGVPLEAALDTFVLSDERSDDELAQMQAVSRAIHDPARVHQLEIFWLVPMAIASKLQDAGQFQAALDWYQTVFAFQLPPENRRIYHGLVVEADTTSNFGRDRRWLITALNPHVFARERRNCYTRSTVMSIARCLHAFADAEFARSTPDGNARARTLYETAGDLLDLPEAQPESGPAFPFPINPVWVSLRDYGRSSLAKLHGSLNIAGLRSADPAGDSTLPSQYRYAVLIERAKNFVAIAQQVEAAFLSALEQRDAKTYDALQAGQHLEVARSTVAMHEVRVVDAAIGVGLAGIQLDRAQLQQTHFATQISNGLNTWESIQLGALGVAAGLQTAAAFAFAGGSVISAFKQVFTFGLMGNAAEGAGQTLSAFAGAASTGAQIAQTKASFERRVEEWRLQEGLAGFDVNTADQQLALSRNQFQLALLERGLATQEMDHAAAVVEFLATRFTNAELFEWMSGVLGRVYAYFLQQATALAQLAEAQLAFERQEVPFGFIRSDYWRDSSNGASAVTDRRGLTGSAQLLQDAHRLDQYAFETERRKLHLVQTFPLSQIGAIELHQLRETGVATFATPEVLFDCEFPGHYLRLIKRVRISLVALLPPLRGVRATLAASGVSRTVVARGPFATATLRRSPESIAFTAAINATGLFELEPEGGLLLPFEGMGVDTVWRLELPKPANPFDFRSIAEVVLTVEYTALDSPEYRQQVVRRLDQRFSGDRAFSLRNDFPDAWYDLGNPDAVDPERRMVAEFTVASDDLPPHVEGVRLDQLTLYVLRKEGSVDELTVSALTHTGAGPATTGGEVRTIGGIITSRRPAGTPWRTLLGVDPTGSWQLRLPDDVTTRSLFVDQAIDDIVVVLTLAGTSPPWP